VKHRKIFAGDSAMELDAGVGFQEFGPSFLSADCIGAQEKVTIPRQRLDARRAVRETCPDSPGVYGWLDPNGQLSYVGKSKALKKRLLSYFSKTVPDEKMKRIRRQSRTIVWQSVSHELLALLREQELINRWRPSFNSQGQPTRRRPAYVCITNTAAPNAVVQRQINQKSGQQRFGPILGTSQLRGAIENLNNVFNLRDCPDKTSIEYSNQLELFPQQHPAKCIRFELATCPAPCARGCSKTEYMAGVDRAIAFLNGFDRSMLDDLKSRMQKAAMRKSFETAAIFRDRWESLAWLDRRLETLRRARMELNCIYELPGLGDTRAWLVLDGGLPIGCFSYPADQMDATQLEQPLTQLAGRNERMPVGPLETNFQMIVLSWFRHRSEESKNLISVGKARRICRNVA